jgi:monoamine oxidase
VFTDELAPMSLRRRALLAGVAPALLAACQPPGTSGAHHLTKPLLGGWIGADVERGHRWRSRNDWPAPALQRRAEVLILGAGVAGLAAARSFMQQGIDDVQLLELEDHAGGNSRGHQIAGLACPLGAHYLPLPGPQARELSAWLHEIGLLRQQLGRTVADERHLCHSPQERLFIDGEWVEGLLPPAAVGSSTHAQYQQLAALIGRLQQGQGQGAPANLPAFALPSHRAAFGAPQAELDALTFANWLALQKLDDAKLLAYLDYCCRDDYGAGIDTVSAWAGVHYFASRHGFHPGGDDGAERDAVFTWPEGNAWLVQRLAAPLGERLRLGRTALRVSVERHAVNVLAFDHRRQQVEAWRANTVVLALPLHVASRIVENAPDALRESSAHTVHAPWLVANLQLDAPLFDRAGAAPAWDNVIHGSAGLGYVDAMHQSLRPQAGPTVLTAYRALPFEARRALIEQPWQHWAQRVIDELSAVHPDLPRRLQRIELMRWGHAMAVPLPGQRARASRGSLAALRLMRGRLRFAHSDLASFSVFEEAFTLGHEAALPLPPRT